MAERLADHGQALADRQAAAGETVAQVADARVPGARPDALSRMPQSGEVASGLTAGNRPRIVRVASQDSQQLHGRRHQRRRPSAGFGVGEPRGADIEVGMLSAQFLALGQPASGRRQESVGAERISELSADIS